MCEGVVCVGGGGGGGPTFLHLSLRCDDKMDG